MKVLRLFLLGCLCAAMTMRCATNPTATTGGGGIETVALVGHVVLPDNRIPENAVVFIRQTWFVSGAPAGMISPDAAVDANGNFRIDSVRVGAYRIEVNDQKQFAGIFNCDVTARTAVQDIGLDTMQPYAAISGSVVAPSSGAASLFVQVYGMERFTRVDSLGRFAFLDLPAGDYSLHIVANQAAIGPRDTSNVVAVAGASTVVAPVTMFTFASESYAGWKYSKTIMLNTTAAGANVAANVENFPLLVRLTGANFDFSEASGGGEDIRFANASGDHLKYEIARFDRTSPAAEVWILLDTVKGNTDTQTITMYWGRPDLTNWSNGAAVFPSSSGYAAVWHLDGVEDATGNGNTLAIHGSTASPGISGNGFYFDGTSGYLECASNPSLNMASKDLTIIVWEKTNVNWRNERIFFEHNVWPGAGTYSFSSTSDSILSFDFPSAQAQVRAWHGSNSDNAWHCLAATFSDARDTGWIYRDGVMINADTVRSSIGSGETPSYIGCRGGVERFFKGDVDEVWVLSRIRPAEWLKLHYENMRENQRLYMMR
jgi:hypothetical protein